MLPETCEGGTDMSHGGQQGEARRQRQHLHRWAELLMDEGGVAERVDGSERPDHTHVNHGTAATKQESTLPHLLHSV